MFDARGEVTIYYLAWAIGWGPTFGGRPTAIWLRSSTLSIDRLLELTIAGNPGTPNTILSRVALSRNEEWQVMTNVTLDGIGKAVLKLSPAADGSRFYKLSTTNGEPCRYPCYWQKSRRTEK